MNCKYTEVVKRSGDVVKFAKIKILNAVYSAWNDVSKCSRSKAKEVTEKIVERINNLTDTTITVEKIQDMVEAQLMESAGHEVAKSYIIYRYEHNADRAHKNNIINPEKLVDSYLDQSDWRVKENANAGFSYASLINHVSGAVVASYTLNKIYPTDIKNAHINGYFHIHDLTAGIVGYCAGHSLPTLINDGFKGVHGRASAKPAKHFDTILGQMVNFLFTLQTEWAGAQAFNSVDTLLAPFVYIDKLSYKEVRQAVQVFLFQLNIAARLGQSAFTNLSFDWTVPDDLKDSPAIIGGEPTEYVYGDFQKEMDMINKAFIEVMTEGDGAGRLFSFPIPTYSLTKDFDWDSENANLLFAMTAKYGVPYFQNYIKSDLNPSDVRSLCCRLRLDLSELRKKTGGVFGASDSTGSIGVVTLNLPLMAYEAKNEDDFFKSINKYMELAKESLEIKRELVEQNYEAGLMPYTRIYLKNFNSHFQTIGLVGMNEACLNLIGKDITTDEGQGFAIKTLNYMKEITVKFQQETGHLFNLEATPAEGTSFRLAKISKEKYNDIICAGKDVPYFTNSSQLPVGYTENLFEALDKQETLQCTYNGGTVFHTFLGEAITPESCKKLVKSIAYNYAIPYFSITPTFSVCPEHGYISGEHYTCPHCK